MPLTQETWKRHIEKKFLWILEIAALCAFSVSITGYNSTAVAYENNEEKSELKEQQFLFLMEEAYVQRTGEFQVSFTSQYMDGKKSREAEYEEGETQDTLQLQNTWQWMTEIEYGILDWWQVELEIPLGYIDKQTTENGNDGQTIINVNEFGIGDVAGGMGFRLLKEDETWWRPTVFAGIEAIFPTGNWRKDLGAGAFGWESNLAASKVINNFVCHVTLGMGRTNNAREEGETEKRDETEFGYGAALVYRPTDKLDLIIETFTGFEEEKTTENKDYETESYITPGIRYELFEDFEIGAGVPVGITCDSYDWGIIVKVQYEW